jgi:cyanophycinase
MKTLVLAGSGEFTESMFETDRYLLSLTKKPARVAIIPTASVPDKKQQKWIDNGVKHFSVLGVSSFGVNISDRKEADKQENLEKITTATFIYFSGGHPGFLYKVFHGTKAWKLITDLYSQGIILAGSSAGAMIMGDYLLGNAQESFGQEASPEWIKGFSLVPYVIYPHYDWIVKNKPEDMKKISANAPQYLKKSWLGIDEDTALILTDDKKAKIMGKGTVKLNSNNNSTVYKSGQEFNFQII